MIYPHQTEQDQWSQPKLGTFSCGLCAMMLVGITLLSITGLAGCETRPTQHQWMVVRAPYLDVRTGPGRGYPITHSVLRGERIEILYERTGYFKIRTPDNLEGWIEAGPLLDPKSAQPTNSDR